MRLAVIFYDSSEMLGVRREYSSAHLEYLLHHEAEILIAGGLRDSEETPFVGGLWVLEVISKERAIEIIEGDPLYFPDYRSYKIFLWGKAFADKPVLL